jgi:diadenosine tetraphosphatase ApaH/serine/threonine PP2A family protein phosphatase
MAERIAILSDIHANFESLEAVIQDLSKQNVDRVVCLGDVIGYGVNPREVLKKCHMFQFLLRGNHEDGLLFHAFDFNPDASRVIDWTRNELNSPSYNKQENFQLWNFIDSMKEYVEEGNILYVHASPRDYTKEYIRPVDITDREKMHDIFSRIEWLCFCGHTHEPGVFTEDCRFLHPSTFKYKVKIPENRKFIINVGAVGQPRDGDPRACYVIFENPIIEFRRVEYDVKKTIEKMLSNPTIPRRFGARLEIGR